jgi:FkbM family methyltransferase
MIKRFYEHSFELDIINPGGWGVDFGCGSDFYISKTFLDFGLKTIAVDPNPAIKEIPKYENLYFENAALVIDDSSELNFHIYNDQDAASLKNPKNDVYFLQKLNSVVVKTTTIDKLMQKYDIHQFEILKLDIEGAEYDFLMTINKPIAKQISIEFHDFRGLNPYYPNNEKYYNELIKKLSPFYQVVKHNIEKHPGLSGPQSYNYWDSLFILK